MNQGGQSRSLQCIQCIAMVRDTFRVKDGARAGIHIVTDGVGASLQNIFWIKAEPVCRTDFGWSRSMFAEQIEGTVN